VRRRRPARELRTAIDCMPVVTRQAMKDAIAVNPIIVGAYSDRDGGVCPMLAAHRNGGRTSFASFGAFRPEPYSASPARMNWISGTKQPGEVRSR
jgi:hypothetical protein